MAVQSTNVNRPKRQKGSSKKSKASWRKNTEIEDIEDFIEDQRLEERLGGAFDKRSDSELFVLDNTTNEALIPDPTIETPVLDKRAARKKKASLKKLKCLSHLEVENTSAIQDPKKGRNRRKTPEERRNPTIKRKEAALHKAGIIKAKMALATAHRQQEEKRKEATLLERTTRRRTEFDFDLWNTDLNRNADSMKQNESHLVENSEWLEKETKYHTLKNTRQRKNKLPRDFHAKQSALSAVELPHEGTSYNPSYKDHQDLLWKAAMVELNKERKQRKIDHHTTDMFPNTKDAPTEKTWLSEMSEGIDVLNGGEKDTNHPAEDERIDSESDEQCKLNKLKTRKQRRKELKLKISEKKLEATKKEKIKTQDVFRIKSMKKEIIAEERAINDRMVKRAEQKEAKKFSPLKLSAHKFEEPELDLKLSDELTGSLKSLKPEGNLLVDRFKSMQKRNIIDTRVKKKIVKNKRKWKKPAKRNYKMGFDWEKK